MPVSQPKILLRRVLVGILCGTILGTMFAYFVTDHDGPIGRYAFDALKRGYAVTGGGLAPLEIPAQAGAGIKDSLSLTGFASIANTIPQASEGRVAGSGDLNIQPETIIYDAPSSSAPYIEESVIVENIVERAIVKRVVDGDTIEIEFGDPSTHAQGKQLVRYIGIDSPEVATPDKLVECFGPEAREANRALVLGREVRLEGDINNRDQYQRLLRYVYLPGADGETFVNLELVRRGYAYASAYPPDVKYSDEFAEAERIAQASSRGLWGACASAP